MVSAEPKRCDRCREILGSRYYSDCPVLRYEPAGPSEAGEIVRRKVVDLCIECHVVEFATEAP
jgi:hypothetical protein